MAGRMARGDDEHCAADVVGSMRMFFDKSAEFADRAEARRTSFGEATTAAMLRTTGSALQRIGV